MNDRNRIVEEIASLAREARRIEAQIETLRSLLSRLDSKDRSGRRLDGEGFERTLVA